MLRFRWMISLQRSFMITLMIILYLCSRIAFIFLHHLSVPHKQIFSFPFNVSMTYQIKNLADVGILNYQNYPKLSKTSTPYTGRKWRMLTRFIYEHHTPRASDSVKNKHHLSTSHPQPYIASFVFVRFHYWNIGNSGKWFKHHNNHLRVNNHLRPRWKPLIRKMSPLQKKLLRK